MDMQITDMFYKGSRNHPQASNPLEDSRCLYRLLPMCIAPILHSPTKSPRPQQDPFIRRNFGQFNDFDWGWWVCLPEMKSKSKSLIPNMVYNFIIPLIAFFLLFKNKIKK